ncbi:MAG: LysM peptidoglycan-binding domain-containing protein [Sulfurospirillaceae bacterium]|nr:LysM peptidoglycan-binding domain-containing protein [Sulfurospirillaceae bacterium]
MLRIVVILIMLYQGLYAFLASGNNYQKQAQALRSFDIHTSFLKDSIFLSMKEGMDEYKTKHFLQILENGYRFVPFLRKMIRESGIPDGFLYMAMVESNFKATAYSSAKASGLWQFMPYTAKLYGLQIDDYVDERRDPIKSTEAAIKYIKNLYSMFGKWYLVAIAYNCGEGALKKAIAKAGTDNLNVLLDEKQKYIPKESRHFVRKIVTMEYLSNNSDLMLENESEHFLNRGSSFTFLKVNVQAGASLEDIAQSIGVSLKELRSYNVHLKYSFVPPYGKDNYIYIPYDKQVVFAQKFDVTKDVGKYFVHTVKHKESLATIAKKYGVSLNDIKEQNDIKTMSLRPNTKLIVPVLSKKAQNHTVKNGDTVESISKKYNISIADLRKLNSKIGSHLKAGDSIVIAKIY